MSLDLRRQFQAVRKRRRMYVPDERFLSVVAFVDGCDLATNRELLRGFSDWLYVNGVRSGQTSLHWSAVLEIARGLRPRSGLTSDQNEQLVQDLFEALDKFLADRKHVFAVSALD